MSAKIDVAGQTIRGILVIRNSGKRASSRDVLWVCKCPYCGSDKIRATRISLMAGHFQSCGCMRYELIKEKVSTHGRTKTAEYRIWRNMKTRINGKHGVEGKCLECERGLQAKYREARRANSRRQYERKLVEEI